MGLYASKGYLQNRNPAALDLSKERIVAFNESYGEIPELKWISDLKLAGRVVFSTSSTRALINAVRAGGGIALLPDLFAHRIDDLVRMTAKVTLPVRTPWLLVHRDLRKIKQIRIVRDWIVHVFEIARKHRQRAS
jgi:DNA-binding transcriptional LysR family regulator